MTKREELRMWEQELDRIPKERKRLEQRERWLTGTINRLRRELDHV